VTKSMFNSLCRPAALPEACSSSSPANCDWRAKAFQVMEMSHRSGGFTRWPRRRAGSAWNSAHVP